MVRGEAFRPERGLVAVPLIYAFDHPHETPPKDLKDLLGGKGANLAEMTSVLALPVPPGLHHHDRRVPGLPRRRRLARRSRRRDRRRTSAASRRPWAGGWAMPTDPLLVSVRSGAKFSMPGMMDTVLNLGLNDDVGRRGWRSRPATSASPSTRTGASSRCSAASSSASTAPRSTGCSTTPSAWPA